MEATTKILIENVRISYEHVWEPKAIEGSNGGPKYSVSILLPPDHPQMNAIQNALNAAYAKGIETKWGGRAPAVFRNPIRSGNEKDTTKNPEYAGVYFMSASNDRQPMIVDRDKSPLRADVASEKAKIYSGAYCNVLVNLFPYKNVSTGVGCSLLGVQFVADGEAFASQASTEDFASFEPAAPSVTSPFPTLPPR